MHPFFIRNRTILVVILLLCSMPATIQAQTSYSLPQAVDYAIQNSNSIKNATLDVAAANARIGETRAIGLPQINAQVQLQHNFRIQQFISDGRADSPFAPSGSVDPNAVFSFAFGLKNNLITSLTASQLLFSGSYLVALQASKAYKDFSAKQLTAAKVTIAENVTKAYYGVLVNQEQLVLLKVNVERLEKILNETREFYKNGLVEKIDVDRLEVQYNNLKVETQKVERLVNLSKTALKFQMGMPLSEEMVVSEKLADLSNTTFTPVTASSLNYEQRSEYQVLQQVKQLNTLDMKVSRAERYPTLGAAFTTGFNPSATRLQDITDSRRWKNYSFLAFQLDVPIFSGLGSRYKIQQKKLAIQKTENDMDQFKKGVDLQVESANISLENALEGLKTQKKNMELAEEVVRVSQIKYQQGVGSNIEVINAEASLKEAQTNYYAALYDALIAKVDLDKATGNLYK